MIKPATKPASKSAAPSRRRRPARAGTRELRAAERRDAILAAALEQFALSGFAATRLEDVAKRADVAKGTIYLYFADKETLFEELVRAHITPVIGAFEQAARADIPMRAIADRFIEMFVRDIYGTRRKDVIRLVLTEGPRFPKLAEFYHREVISRAMGVVRVVLRRAVERGELKDDTLVRFPQLLVAPGIMTILWNGLFDRFEPLDVRAIMRAHFDLILGDGRTA
jgi:AcrR family transcriptional regulator